MQADAGQLFVTRPGASVLHFLALLAAIALNIRLRVCLTVVTPFDRMACNVKSWLSHLNIKYPAGRSRSLTLVPQMVDPSAIPGNITRKECADVHSFFLNTAESPVIKAEIAHRSRVQGIWSTAGDLCCFEFETRHNEVAYQSVPKPASGYDLLKAAALMRAHSIRIQSSIYLAYKKLHLVSKMLLPNALWQLVTILRT